MQKYLTLLTTLSPRWETGEGNAFVKKEKWICSSTLGFEADEYVRILSNLFVLLPTYVFTFSTPLNEKSICDIVAENDELNAIKLLQSNPKLVYFKDSEVLNGFLFLSFSFLLLV
jgi:hypothetical protein